MKIYIPTRGRHDKQITLQNLPDELKKQVILVVDKTEEKLHKDLYGHGWILSAPSECDSIGKVRQFIIENHNVKKHGPKLIMLDDDLGFNMRRTDIRSRFLPATDEAVVGGFHLVAHLLDELPHGGIRARQMSQDAPDIEYNCRTLRALAYDVPIVRSSGARFDRLIVMEDFDVTLQLLKTGYSNFNISSIIQGQGSSNAKGGCSLYRDAERQAQGAHGLASLHPEFVRVRTKKTNWSGWGSDERVDVTISWKKAYEAGIKLKEEQNATNK